MADDDLEIRVRSSADLTAIKQAKAAIDDLAARTKTISSEAFKPGFGGPPVPAELLTSGGAFGEGAAGYAGLTHVSADLERSTFAVGLNLTRARQEAIILARELATGVPTTRTLSSLLGSLGIPIAAAATIAIGMFEGFKKSSEQVNKLIDESKSLGDELAGAALKWQSAARAAISPEDVRKVASEAVPELDKIHEKAKSIQEEQVGLFGRISDSITHAFSKFSPAYAQVLGGTGRPFQDAADQAKKNAEELEKLGQHRAALDLQRAEKQEKELDAQKQSVQETEHLNKIITNLRAQQDALDKGAEDYAKRWLTISQFIGIAESKIKALQKPQEDIAKSVEKSVKQGAADLGETADDYFKQSEKRQELHQREIRAAQLELDELTGRDLTPEQKTRQKTLQALLSPEAEKGFQEAEERRFLERDLASGRARPGEDDVQFRARMSNEAYRLNQLGPGSEGGDTAVDWLKKIYQLWQ